MKYRTLRLLAVAAVFWFIHRLMSPAQTAGTTQIEAGEHVYSDNCPSLPRRWVW